MRSLGSILRRVAGLVGSTIKDVETGEILGKAIVLVWKGRVHLIGYTGSVPLRPVAVPSRDIAYWRLTLGFAAPREPDYPSLEPSATRESQAGGGPGIS